MNELPPLWRELTRAYLDMPVAAPRLRMITLAQWAVESHWGTSRLATQHNNFAGLNYRWQLWWYARPVTYVSSDGRGVYSHFRSIEAFIRGYWRFIDRPRYRGWRAFAADPEAFIAHLKSCGYASDPHYVDKVLRAYRHLATLA
jgi:N-acetylmuramoyl-L-alanine amidase